ncbi:hypothetical protein [Streptomyces chrestomyceticus]|uniref:hypothetical protein n=1 Tax=Streptomyces chrestomyceticus TaxID=68185 RepID=UPI0033D8B9EC
MKYFYVITVEIPELGTSTANEVIEMHPDWARHEIYRHALNRCVQQMLDSAPYRPDRITPITKFWSLEPDSIMDRA